MGSNLDLYPNFKQRLIDEHYIKLNTALNSVPLIPTSTETYYYKVLKFHIALELGVFYSQASADPGAEATYRSSLIKNDAPLRSMVLPNFPSNPEVSRVLLDLRQLTCHRLVFCFFCACIKRTQPSIPWDYSALHKMVEGFISESSTLRRVVKPDFVWGIYD